MTLIQKIRQILGMYEPGCQYWIPLKDITILPSFSRSWIGKQKWKRKKSYYHRTGQFESQIILNKDFVLLDGYSSYKIAKYIGLKEVPVLFSYDK